MRRSLPISIALLLGACGVAANSSNDSADAAAQRARTKARPRQPVVDDMRFDRGGMAGCFDPNLTGYARRAAEEIGGVPCDERPSDSASRPNAPSRQITWLVGAWVNRGERCGGEGLVFNANGSYWHVDDNGRWALSGNTLTITALRRAVRNGELGEDTPIRNPQPTLAQVITRTPNAFSLRHANGAVTHWTRCR